ALPIFSLQALLARLIASEKISTNSKIYFVDDGSRDSTWTLLKTAAEEHTDVVAIKLSRNNGHQNALYAGLRTTIEYLVVSIDADLQDDPANIEYMVDEFHKGNDVVYGVRSAR